MTANPFAALLAGVPRTPINDDADNGYYLSEDAVLVALAATVPADLAEAGKVAEELQAGYELVKMWPELQPDGFSNLLSLRNKAPEAADTIRSLIALATAQAARIEGLEAERDRVGLEEKMRMTAWCSKRQAITAKAWQRAARKALAGDMSELRNRIDMIDAGPLDIVQSSDARAEAAETALAAERARVAKLVALVEEARLMIYTKTLAGKLWDDNARAAITEAGE